MKSEKKRAQILEAARSVFLKGGFDGASMEEISHVAGVSKGTLYAYFQSKEDLFTTSVAADHGNDFHELYAHFDADADLECNLEKLACSYLDRVLAPNHLSLFQVVVGGAAKFPLLGKWFFEVGMQTTSERLEEILRHAATKTGRRIENPKLAATHFFGSLYASAVFPTVIGQVPVPTDAERALTIRHVVNALLTQIDKS